MSLESTPSVAGQSVVTTSSPAAAPASVPVVAPAAAKPSVQPQQQQQQKQKPGKQQRKGGFGFNPAPKL
jgi:hypothetical protein